MNILCKLTNLFYAIHFSSSDTPLIESLNKFVLHNILTVNNKIPISCKTVLLIGQRATVHRSIARYRTVDRWPYFHHLIDHSTF